MHCYGLCIRGQGVRPGSNGLSIPSPRSCCPSPRNTIAKLVSFSHSVPIRRQWTISEEDSVDIRQLSKQETPFYVDVNGPLQGYGKRIRPSDSKSSKFTTVEGSECGKYLFIGSDKGHLHAYETRFLTHIKTFHQHQGAILSIINQGNVCYFTEWSGLSVCPSLLSYLFFVLYFVLIIVFPQYFGEYVYFFKGVKAKIKEKEEQKEQKEEEQQGLQSPKSTNSRRKRSNQIVASSGPMDYRFYNIMIVERILISLGLVLMLNLDLSLLLPISIYLALALLISIRRPYQKLLHNIRSTLNMMIFLAILSIYLSYSKLSTPASHQQLWLYMPILVCILLLICVIYNSAILIYELVLQCKRKKLELKDIKALDEFDNQLWNRARTESIEDRKLTGVNCESPKNSYIAAIRKQISKDFNLPSPILQYGQLSPAIRCNLSNAEGESNKYMI